MSFVEFVVLMLLVLFLAFLKLIDSALSRRTGAKRVEVKNDERFWEKLVERVSVLSERDFSEIVGQRRAIEELLKALKVGVKQLGRERRRERVLSSMIFVGATGVGKTETAKLLAEVFSSLGYQFIRVDLSQYRTPESAWTLIGSPRGYVGSEYGGTLTRALMKNPRAIILFDEMEKAHPDLHTTFMTLLDEGYVEEQSTGWRVYLQGGIIVFTSNLHSETIAEMVEREEDEIELELKLRSFVETYFGRPEIVGRIDAIIPFRRLSQRDLEEIARRVLAPYGKVHLSYQLTEKLSGLARKYGVRVFVKKLREIAVSEGSFEKIEKRDGEGIEFFE